MRILYIGHKEGTSGYRAAALSRIGCDMTQVDPYATLPPLWGPWLYRLGGPGFDSYVSGVLQREIPAKNFDVVWIDGGEIMGRKCLVMLRRYGTKVVHLTLDNPYRLPPHPERRRWSLFHSAISFYDLCITVRRPKIENRMRECGARNILTFWQPADEIIHHSDVFTSKDRTKWFSNVVFVGTWMPGRGAFLVRLIEKGVPLKIYGDRWHKAPEYSRLSPFIGGGAVCDLDYTRAIAGAKIAIVLLNGDNNDLHTTRSAEIPAIGTLMCAPRTQDHMLLYKEDKEAVFFEEADECAEKCKALLADDDRRLSIARAGHERVKINRMYNEPLVRDVIEALKACK